jgi:uncharacterized membrane protein
MKKLINVILILLFLPASSVFAEDLLNETHFGNGKYPTDRGVVINSTWQNKFTKEACITVLQNFPFEREVDEANKFMRKTTLDASGVRTENYVQTTQINGYNPITPSPSLLQSTNDGNHLKRLVAPCQCLATFESLRQLNTVFSKELRDANSDSDRQAAIEEKKKRLQKRYWIEDHILSRNNMCDLIYVVRTSPPPTTPAAPATPPPEVRVNYCIYKESNLTIFDTHNASNIKGIKKLIQIDSTSKGVDEWRKNTKSCTIDTNREICLLNLYAAQAKCENTATSANISNNLKPEPETADLTIESSCENLRYFGCIGGTKPEYLNIEPGFTSESLDVNKVLKTEQQQGFQVLEDQGAGANNPAINFILYIINTLSNLSFLVSVFFLIMGGFYLVIASGNSEMTDKGKTAIKNFIFAITFTLLSYTIVVIIRTLLYS